MSLPEGSDPVWKNIAVAISQHTGRNFIVRTAIPVSGGCINRAARVESDERCYFVKFNAAAKLSMFEAEADGLRALKASSTIRAPSPVCSGRDGTYAWLVLEYLGPLGAPSHDAWQALGAGLARMHRTQQARYGWLRNNTIGATPQINSLNDDWVAFVRHHRIGFQLDLAQQNGYTGQLQTDGRALLERLGHFFKDYAPPASLLHGDLWSGNVAAMQSGEPVLFDPATYFGDRETDIAMTELFGGFSPAFYRAYEAAWPLDPGYPRRRPLYNLYHLLNHLNLFGEGYLSQCEASIRQLLAHTV